MKRSKSSVRRYASGAVKTIVMTTAVAAAALGLAGPAGAETLRLTLEEAIGLGIKNSSTVQSKTIAIASAKAATAATKAARYPSLSLTATWSRLWEQPSPVTLFIPNPAEPDNPTKYSLGYQVAQNPFVFSFDLNQPIYTFGKIKNSILKNEKGIEAAEMELKEETRKLAVEISKAFYGYILAKEAVKINEGTLKFKEETLDAARKKYDAGIASDFEVLQAESDVINFQPQLISSRNQVSFALLAVMDLLNVKAEEGFDVELIGELKPEYRTFDKQEIFKKALDNKYEIQSFKKGIEAAELQTKLVRSANKPTFSAFSNYTIQSQYDATTGKDVYWGEGAWRDDLTFGAVAQVPISALFPWSKERADKTKDQLDYEQLKLSLTTIESGVRLNIENLLLKLEEEKSKIASMDKSVELMSRLYRTTRERYGLGLVSNIELRDAETNLNSAQLGRVQAIYNYTVTFISLLDAAGVDRL
jgi:outer membrane protein TolC